MNNDEKRKNVEDFACNLLLKKANETSDEKARLSKMKEG